MKIRVYFSLLTIAAFISFSAFIADDDPFLALIKKLETFTKKYPAEKIHLHLDKPYYAIGDNIWFNAYVTDSRTAAPTNLSKVLYAELINEHDSLLKILTLSLHNGIGWGDFALADTLSEGNYRIRAYTNLMRNAGTDFFFDKTLKIGKSWSNSMFVHTDYTYKNQAGQDIMEARIRLSDKNGKAIAGARIEYNVDVDGRMVNKGRYASTSSAGEFMVPLINAMPKAHGKIVAKITLPDKEVVTKEIPIKTIYPVDVQFFPESGSLIAGLPCQVAFKAVNATGKGEDVQGTILDNTGMEVSSFKSAHLGMGSFYMNALPDKTYRAKVTFKNGMTKWVDLPKSEKSGYTLHIDPSDEDRINLKIMFSNNLSNKGQLSLLAQQNGVVYVSAKISTTEPLARTTFKKTDLPAGIITLTLFDGQAIPVAERIVFVNRPDENIRIQADRLNDSYEKRKPVDITFSGTFAQQPVRASYSVAVTNSRLVEPDLENESHIFSSLLLQADLKGYIENPNYYFLSDDAKTKADLDLLMLTQGWRKIDWKLVNSTTWPAPKFEAETGLKISGYINTLNGKTTVPGGKVALFSSSHGGLFVTDTVANAQGYFKFDQLEFPDSTKFVIQGRNTKGKEWVKLKLDTVTLPFIAPNKNRPAMDFNINESLKSYLTGSEAYFDELVKSGLLNRTIRLKTVEIKGRLEKKFPHSLNLNGPGRADAVIMGKDLENVILLSSFLNGRIPGITFENGKAYSRRAPGMAGSPMSIYIDGVHIEEMNLDDINADEIETIEVLKSIGTTAVYGGNGRSGVLVITTKRGDGSFNYLKPAGIMTYYPRGYSLIRQFYSPRHDVKPDPKPDLRTTVYWNPSILSDEQGRFKIDYFNTDESGTYRIVIEGIDAEGHLARQVFTYDVK